MKHQKSPWKDVKGKWDTERKKKSTPHVFVNHTEAYPDPDDAPWIIDFFIPFMLRGDCTWRAPLAP